nr:uncharacterized protein LOC129263294 [Lytechinus pictus]
MHNSEAVRSSMVHNPAWARPVPTREPHPPFAVDRPRPHSAPMKRATVAGKPNWRDARSNDFTKQQRKFNLSLRHTSNDSHMSRIAPYAARRLDTLSADARMRAAIYPRVENGCKVQCIALPECRIKLCDIYRVL